MSAKNLETVKNYFKYCVDGKDAERVSEYFDADVIVHRPDCDAPIHGPVSYTHLTLPTNREV